MQSRHANLYTTRRPIGEFLYLSFIALHPSLRLLTKAREKHLGQGKFDRFKKQCKITDCIPKNKQTASPLIHYRPINQSPVGKQQV